MKKVFIATMLCLALACAALTAGCAAPGGDSGGAALTDMAGREVSLKGPATRVVALTAADCEILYAIGAGGALVGRGEYCDYPPEVLGVPAVQSGPETNLEQIIALKPQVVLMSTMAQNPEQLKALESAGIQTVVSDAKDIEGVYAAIKLMGDIMGKKSEAGELIAGMKGGFSAVSANAAENKGKTIYFEVSPLEYGLWTAGAGTFMNEVAEMLGLENCFADVDGWGEVSEEQVISRSPDYIVTVSMFDVGGMKPDEEIMSRAGWGNIEAVKNKAVLNLAGNELSRPSYRLAEGAAMLGDFVNGH